MLRALGIEKAFLPGADFGNITETDAMVSKVIQGTMLKLDPNGAEGAAYTIFAVPSGLRARLRSPFSRSPARHCLLGRIRAPDQ